MVEACVVCGIPADVYCHNDKAFLCKACDITVHSAHALASSHHRTPVNREVETVVENISDMADVPQGILDVDQQETSFDADDWFAVPDMLADTVAHPNKRGKKMDKHANKNNDDFLDFAFKCPPWELSTEADPLGLIDFSFDVPGLDDDEFGVPPVPSPDDDFDNEVPAASNSSRSSEAVPNSIAVQSTVDAPLSKQVGHDVMPPKVEIGEFLDDMEVAEATFHAEDVPPIKHEAVSMFPSQPVPVQAYGWIQSYVPHTLLPLDPTVRAASLAERRERVSRFRAKKKSFHFKKTIRYASRKRYAEKRPRIKGRFARKDEIEAAIKAGVPLEA